MGCGCVKTRQERIDYENIKRLAERWAKNTGKVVYLFREGKGYHWQELDGTPEHEPIEYISPLQ